MSDLYAGVAVVGGDDPVLGEDKVERAACLPSSQIYLDRRVGLGVPLVDLVEPIQDVAVYVLGHVLRQLELLLLVEKSVFDGIILCRKFN